MSSGPRRLARSLTVASRYCLSGLFAMELGVFAAGKVAAQPAEPPPRAAAAADAAVPGSELTVYLMTMGPGDAVWEKFGHNAIWIHDAARNTDVAYNWGLFDFEASDFMSRFLRGNMRYWMGGFEMKAMVDFYKQSNRSVFAQELNLTPAQRSELARFVEWNALPENRFYNYDYYRDNCSTRVRDVIDRALGGALRREIDGPHTSPSYRFETRRLLADDQLVYAGTMLGLGHPVDRRLSGWEEGFLPDRLSQMLADVSVPGDSQQVRPLVAGKDTLFLATRPSQPTRDNNTLEFFLLGMFFFAILTSMARAAHLPGGHRLRPVFLIAAALWSVIIGVAGLGLIALWTLTNHTYSYRNENILQATFVSLVLAVAILVQLRSPRPNGGSSTFVGPRTLQLARLVLGLSALGLVMKILPIFRQDNLDVIALILPTHLGVALALSGGDIIPARFRRRRAQLAPT